MLYDKRWDKPEVKFDPFSLDSLVAWLEKQPAAKRYCYTDPGHCLLTQYFSAMGFKRVLVSPIVIVHGFMSPRECRHQLPPEFRYIAIGYPRTFGKALTWAHRLQHAGVA